MQINSEIVTAIKDGTIAIAAVSGATVAWLGLWTWNRQLRGTTEYELARRYLRAAYTVRDEIARFRAPLITPQEMAAALKESGAEAEDPVSAGSRAAYVRRWNRVVDAVSDLRVDALEAEVLWGAAAKNATEALQACAGELSASLTMFLDRNARNPGFQLDSATKQRIERVMYQTSRDPDKDEFTKSIMEAVGLIEGIVRPHLRR